MDRRVFIKRLLHRLLIASGLAFLAYPVISFMTFRKNRDRKIVFQAEDVASSVNYKDGVYLILRNGESRALSARCTHLGCTLTYDVFSRKFRCPCHGSVFSLSGRRLEGPARKDLQTVPLKREESGDIVVTLSL